MLSFWSPSYLMLFVPPSLRSRESHPFFCPLLICFFPSFFDICCIGLLIMALVLALFVNQALGEWWSGSRWPWRSRPRRRRRCRRQEPKPFRLDWRKEPRPHGKRRRLPQQPGILWPRDPFHVGGVSASDLRAAHSPRNFGLLQRCK